MRLRENCSKKLPKLKIVAYVVKLKEVEGEDTTHNRSEEIKQLITESARVFGSPQGPHLLSHAIIEFLWSIHPNMSTLGPIDILFISKMKSKSKSRKCSNLEPLDIVLVILLLQLSSYTNLTAVGVCT